MRKYFALSLPKDHTFYHSWQLGKLMLMLLGINFTDLIMLQGENIRHGRVIYTRSKTRKQYSVRLLPEDETIISEMCRQ